MTFRTSTVCSMGKDHPTTLTLTASMSWCKQFGDCFSTRNLWKHTTLALWWNLLTRFKLYTMHSFGSTLTVQIILRSTDLNWLWYSYWSLAWILGSCLPVSSFLDYVSAHIVWLRKKMFLKWVHQQIWRCAGITFESMTSHTRKRSHKLASIYLNMAQVWMVSASRISWQINPWFQ